MIRIGDILDATVVRVEPFGLFIDADGVPGLILIPELSWSPVSHPSKVASVGDWLTCKVVHLPADPPKHGPSFTASIRELTPEDNPWRDPSVFAVGTAFSGTVDRQASYGFFILHPRGALALLPTNEANPSIEIGDEVAVIVTECDVDERKVRVQLDRQE